jgi:hypothetical protein
MESKINAAMSRLEQRSSEFCELEGSKMKKIIDGKSEPMTF